MPGPWVAVVSMGGCLPVTSPSVSMARSLERRLERLLEAVAGSVFTGRLHPSEIAGKIAREADFARFDHDTGPATANQYTILVNPGDLGDHPADLERTLTEEVARYTAEEGLRLEGPPSVVIEATDEVSPGAVLCHPEVVPGQSEPWARLVGGDVAVEIGRNRVLIGRGSEADVVLPDDDVSRRHALLWRQGGQVWIRDLVSANGTSVDSVSIGPDASLVQSGSVVGFSGHRYRFMEI